MADPHDSDYHGNLDMALKITLQHDETGRRLDWSLDKPIPAGYSIVSNEQGPVFGQWELPKEWAEDFGLGKEHNETLSRIANLAAIGAAWKENSSLEKWFPITAEELATLKQDLIMARNTIADQLNRLKIASKDAEDNAAELAAVESALGFRECFDEKGKFQNSHQKSLERIRDLIAAEGLCGDLKDDNAKLRAALVGLIGADGEELDGMEALIRISPHAPDSDRIVTINAIHALRDTLPKP